MSKKVNEIVTEKIIELIQSSGKLPWIKPWNNTAVKNCMSGHEYRGINRWILGMAANLHGSHLFLSFKQGQELGGSVRKGERGYPVVFFTMVDDKRGEDKKFPVMRYYTVFNVNQFDGIDGKRLTELDNGDMVTDFKDEFKPIDKAEKLVSEYLRVNPTLKIQNAVNMAAYSGMTDVIYMPDRNTFKGIDAYYSTLFHEMGHSTGHEKRLNREGVVTPNKFGSHAYSKEELVAEFTASFLRASCGIDSVTELQQSAAYLQNWVKVLGANPEWLVKAASLADKASMFIIEGSGVKTEGKTEAISEAVAVA